MEFQFLSNRGFPLYFTTIHFGGRELFPLFLETAIIGALNRGRSTFSFVEIDWSTFSETPRSRGTEEVQGVSIRRNGHRNGRGYVIRKDGAISGAVSGKTVSCFFFSGCIFLGFDLKNIKKNGSKKLVSTSGCCAWR